MKTAWLAGGGDFFAAGFKPQQNDIVIAVDAGYSYLEDMGIVPDTVVGDFDSLEFIPDHPEVETHPAIKDDTDMMLAVKKGIEKGCTRFMIFGGTGGRIAHTLGNLQTLCGIAESGFEGYMIDKDYIFTAISNSKLAFSSQHSGYISLLPWGTLKANITIKGLKYEIDRTDLPHNRPLGISNEFTGKEAEITAHSGTVIAVFESQGILPEREETK